MQRMVVCGVLISQYRFLGGRDLAYRLDPESRAVPPRYLIGRCSVNKYLFNERTTSERPCIRIL